MSKRKNNNFFFFSQNAQFSAQASPLHRNDVVQKVNYIYATLTIISKQFFMQRFL